MIKVLAYAIFVVVTLARSGILTGSSPVGDYIKYGALIVAGGVFILFALNQVIRAVVLFGMFASIVLCLGYAWTEITGATPQAAIKQYFTIKPSVRGSKISASISVDTGTTYKQPVTTTTLAEVEHSLGM